MNIANFTKVGLVTARHTADSKQQKRQAASRLSAGQAASGDEAVPAGAGQPNNTLTMTMEP